MVDADDELQIYQLLLPLPSTAFLGRFPRFSQIPDQIRFSYLSCMFRWPRFKTFNFRLLDCASRSSELARSGQRERERKRERFFTGPN